MGNLTRVYPLSAVKVKKESFPIRINAGKKSVRFIPAIFAAISWDTLPCSYQTAAAASLISLLNSSGAYRITENILSGNSIFKVVIFAPPHNISHPILEAEVFNSGGRL
jgi:hypothetical protein